MVTLYSIKLINDVLILRGVVRGVKVIVRFDVNNSGEPLLNGIYQHNVAQSNEQRIAN